MTSFRLQWIALHLLPLFAIPLITHSFNSIAGINTAAVIALVVMIAGVAFGQARLISNKRVTSSRWMWQSGCAIGIAIAAGLVVMSTIDLAGYDALATFSGMTAAGLVFGLIQAPMVEEGRLRWVVASIAGWLIGALVFRNIIASLAAISIGGFAPYGLAYNAGHNELLWSATGIAFYGCAALFVHEEHARSVRRI